MSTGFKILVVDDEVQIADTLAQALEFWGHQAKAVFNGKSAMRELEHNHYDLLILDIYLPDGPGHLLIPAIKDLQPHIKIITMTGSNTRELETRVRQTGVLYYLCKPFELYILKEILDFLEKQTSKRDMGRGHAAQGAASRARFGTKRSGGPK